VAWPYRLASPYVHGIWARISSREWFSTTNTSSFEIPGDSADDGDERDEGDEE
jgi:hypothetical protein